MARARSTRWLLVAIAAIVTSIAQPAAAASLDDPPYARGPLDLKRLVAFKHDAGAPLHVTVVTYGTWPANTRRQRSEPDLHHLQSRSRGRTRVHGRGLLPDGNLWMRIEDRAGAFVRRVEVRHPEGDVIRVTIPAGLPNPNGHAWIAVAEHWVTETGPCADICRDRVPGSGWLKVTRASSSTSEAVHPRSGSHRLLVVAGKPVCGCGWPRTGRR